ncbi:transcription initiation factor IID, 18kD subunit-domain-containing protein [Flagelloscypha sp. PMI_526]|nr:transcription initiation factor IID, 18kD subunit-domain-containing protein [Flagelloscypha sp. PMI_526]
MTSNQPTGQPTQPGAQPYFSYPQYGAPSTSSSYFQYPAPGYWYSYGGYQQGQAARTAPTSGTSTPQPVQRQYSQYQPPAASGSSNRTTGAAGGKKSGNLKGIFHKDLKTLMYGFGDDRSPAVDTVNVMEEILIEYITDVCTTAVAGTRKQRLGVEDLRKALSRPADAKKLARMEELVFMQEDIRRARQTIDDEMGGVRV